MTRVLNDTITDLVFLKRIMATETKCSTVLKSR